MDLAAGKGPETCRNIPAKSPAPYNKSLREPNGFGNPVSRKVRRTDNNKLVSHAFHQCLC
jgi:hypothetical protein